MPMNIVIQEQRKLLGLTQEQVADFLIKLPMNMVCRFMCC